MIQPQELRIGNLLEHNGLPMKVSGIHSPKPLKDKRFSDKWVIELFDGAGLIDVTIDEVEAIPISEEWLLDFGFKAFGNGGFISLEAFSPGHPSQRFDIDWSKEKGVMCKSRYQADSDFFFMRHIKHVNELQNLFYSLTSEELTLTK